MTTKIEAKMEEIANSGMSFAETINAMNEYRAEYIENKVAGIMAELDYSKHDKRNSRKYAETAIRAWVSEYLDGTITAAQWDEMLAIYTPYNGTY